MKKIVIVFLVIVGLSSGFAQTLDFTTFLSAQSAGSGGPYVSIAGSTEQLLQNPAMYAASKVTMNLVDLTVLMNGAGLSLFSSLIAGVFDFSNMATLLNNFFDAQGRAYILMDVAGPLNFAYSGKGIGFGLYNQTVMSMNIGSVYYANLSAREDLVVAGGVAYQGEIGRGWWYSGGLKVKGLLRAELYYTDSMLNFMMALQTPDWMTTAIPFLLTSGIGFDAGLQIGLYDVLTFGLTCDDAFSTLFSTEYSSLSGFFQDAITNKLNATSSILIPNLKAGLTVYPFLNFMEQHGLRWGFSLGYSHIIDLFLVLPRNPILFLAGSTELTILDRLKVSIGVREALLAAGIVLDLDSILVSTAVFGRELGMEPGERSVYMIMIGVTCKR